MSENVSLGHCDRFSPSQSTSSKSGPAMPFIASSSRSAHPGPGICDAGKRQFFWIRENSLNFTIKQTQLSKQRFTSVWRQRLHQVFNHRSHPPYDLEIVRTAVSDLAEGEIHEIVPVWRSENQAKLAGFIQQFISAQVALANYSQHAMKLIYCEHGSGRIVDRWRE